VSNTRHPNPEKQKKTHEETQYETPNEVALGGGGEERSDEWKVC